MLFGIFFLENRDQLWECCEHALLHALIHSGPIRSLWSDLQEEQERKARAADQCEEGELLVANHQLEVEIQDSETAIRNKHRLYISRIVT